ncbi:peptidase dimerization domain-containing protein, partial [Vibrio parahaemolyticus]
LKGLKGGHSGCDIHTGRGNANKLLGRFLAGHAQELDLRLVEFRGGSLRNAIPREAFVTVALPVENQDKLAELFNHYTELLKTELGKIETGIVTFNEVITTDAQVFSIADQ